MRILVTGAYGFIGTEVTAALRSAGHTVVCCVRNMEEAKRRFPDLTLIHCDFRKDINISDWIPRLENIDAVVNCVGILQSRDPATINAIHYETPRALFDACTILNIRKMVHISALGIDSEVDTLYAQTKLKLEKYLMTLKSAWVILRPSLVYGRGAYGGASLFRALAAFPWIIPVVGNGKQSFQPIHIHDLAKTVKIALENPDISQVTLETVGPEKITIENLFVRLRQWLGFAPAKVVHIPVRLIKPLSVLGDWFEDIPINTTSYKMLQHENTSDSDNFVNTIGFQPVSMQESFIREPSTLQDRWHARLYFLNPLLRISIGLLWLLLGLLPLISSHQMLINLYNQAGITGIGTQLVFFGSALLDITLGLATLCNYKIKWIGTFQILAILLYTTFISWKLPTVWLDPFGAVVNNIPMLVATLVMIVLAGKR